MIKQEKEEYWKCS